MVDQYKIPKTWSISSPHVHAAWQDTEAASDQLWGLWQLSRWKNSGGNIYFPKTVFVLYYSCSFKTLNNFFLTFKRRTTILWFISNTLCIKIFLFFTWSCSNPTRGGGRVHNCKSFRISRYKYIFSWQSLIGIRWQRGHRSRNRQEAHARCVINGLTRATVHSATYPTPPLQLPVTCSLPLSHLTESGIFNLVYVLCLVPGCVACTYFLKRWQDFQSFFKDSFLELLFWHLILTKVDTLPSLSSNIIVTALLLRDHVLTLILAISTLEPNCTYLILPLEQTGCMYDILV